MHPHLKRLVVERQLGASQALFIHGNWGDTPGDLWSQPQVRSTREHTRAYIDDLRGQFNKPHTEA